MTVLCGEHLVLRPITAADEAAVLAYRNDPAVARFQGWALPYTADRFAALLGSGPLGTPGWVNVCITDASGVVGDIGLRRHDDEAEVGISLATAAQGRGYASEALALLTHHAFADLGLRRLHAGMDPANSTVIRLFTRAGWRDEGTARACYWHRDRWADETVHALDRSDWERRSR
jgi:aminoglycoside 6'-N-acetyltransferase